MRKNCISSVWISFRWILLNEHNVNVHVNMDASSGNVGSRHNTVISRSTEELHIQNQTGIL